MTFWAFLAHVLDSKGFTGLLFVAVGVGVFFIVRSLWNTNQSLHRQIAEERKQHAEAMSIVQDKRVGEAREQVEDSAQRDRELYQVINKLDQTMKGYLAGRRG